MFVKKVEKCLNLCSLKYGSKYMNIMLIDVHVISMRTKIRLKKTSYTTANSKIGF